MAPEVTPPKLLAIRGGGGSVRLVDVDERVQLGDPFELGDEAAPIALRPDGLELALPSPHGVVLWSLDTSHWVDAADPHRMEHSSRWARLPIDLPIGAARVATGTAAALTQAAERSPDQG